MGTFSFASVLSFSLCVFSKVTINIHFYKELITQIAHLSPINFVSVDVHVHFNSEVSAQNRLARHGSARVDRIVPQNRLARLVWLDSCLIPSCFGTTIAK
jgi:hypothetical protein